MKKEVSFSARLISLILALGMAVNIGVISVFADEYKDNTNVYAGDLEIGDILEKGAVLYAADKGEGYNKFGAYFDNIKVNEDDTEMLFDRRAMLLEAEADPKNSKRLIMRFEDLYSEGNADSDETLRASLGNTKTVSFSGNVELKETLVINDGKTHIINTNGHDLYMRGSGKGSVIVLENGSTLILRGENAAADSMLYGGDADNGGGILVDGGSKLVVKNMRITGNKAGNGNGGGICVKNGSAELNDSRVENNKAQGGNGGGIYVYANASAKLKKCRVQCNEAYDGGGVANLGTVTLDNCRLAGNKVNGGGAGIWSKGTATLKETDVKMNLNAVNGGGVTNHKDMTLIDCTISNNSVSQWGGGLFIETDGKTVFEGANVISENHAQTGAGIKLRKGDITVENASLQYNVASEAGGGLWAAAGTNVKLDNVTMEENSCKTNGGAINSRGAVEIKDSTISACSADHAGGGVYMDSSKSLTVRKSEIINCQSQKGAGIYMYDGSVILAGGKTRITDNTSNGSYDNIRFREYRNIEVTGKLLSGSEIGIVPPKNRVNTDITTGFEKYNEASPAAYFHCDTNECRINRDENCKEVNLLAGLKATRDSYRIKVHIRVTNDADWWYGAYFYIYGKSNKGKGHQEQINSSGDFHESIDEYGESYTYEYECGSDKFPTAVGFKSAFGNLGVWRDFEGDVSIYINDINVCNHHVVHDIYGYEENTTMINIGGDKYPYPDEFEVDAPNVIENSDTVTISAVDQYGLEWKADGDNTSLENISFPEEDTFKAVDKTGFKWKLSSNHKTNHMSTYEVTFRSGSNVYPKITKAINVKFVFPLHLTVVVNGKEVLDKVGYTNDTIHIPEIQPPTGYYILKYTSKGVGILTKNKESYDFTFVNESVTLTAELKNNNYKIQFEKNGTGPRSSDVTGHMSNITAYYDKELTLPENYLERDGYEFEGWNTQADGMGKMFENRAKVLNLTSEKGAKVKLYAIWKKISGATTASIFSDITGFVYVGLAVLALSIAAAVIYSVRKKKQKEQNYKS